MAVLYNDDVDRHTLDLWARDFHGDAVAVRIRLDPDALLEESEPVLGAWNEAGRGLCARFLEAARSGIS